MILNKKFLCADLGSKFTGLAYYESGDTPYPMMLDRIASGSDKETLGKLQHLIEEDFYTDLIIGVPYLLDGKATETTQKMLNFAKLCQKELAITVHTQDETLSTFEAKDRMKNSPIFNFKVDLKKIDSLSAVIILEDFLSQFDLKFP